MTVLWSERCGLLGSHLPTQNLTTLGETSGAEASAMREEIQVERQAINDAANGNSRPMTPAKLLRGRLLESTARASARVEA